MLSGDAVRNWMADKSGLPLDEIKDHSPIFTKGLLDSFDLVDLVVFVETQTGKRVRPLDINMRNFDTVNRIVAFSERLAKG